jgi:tetratricopeptide (TPR) repeat protein
MGIAMRLTIRAVAALVAVALSAGVAAGQSGDVATCEKGTPEQRLAACTRLIEADGRSKADLSTFYLHRGIAHRLTGKYDRAIKDYEQAIRLDPDNAQAHHSRGTVYYLRGQFDRVIKDADRATALDPKYAIAYEQRGLAFYRKGQIDRAIAEFDKTIELLPKRALALYARGVALRRKGQAARGAADIAAAKSVRSDIAGIAERLGIKQP